MTAFDFAPLFARDLPPAAQPWAGFAEHNFVGGHNDPEGIPVEALIEAATRQLRAKGRELAIYTLDGGPQGLAELREVVAQKLTPDRGAPTEPDQVLITSGSLQGMDLVFPLLVEPGDTVIVEEHTYGGTLTRLRRRGARIVGAPLDEQGLRIDALERLLDDLAARGVRPKFVYTIPTVQNPTGSVLPPDRRRALLALARRHGVPVFEDECYADLVFGEDWPPALRGMQGGDAVIHIGSFSKTLAPALRLGYLVADWPILSRLLAVEREFGTAAEFTRPQGGIFFWMRVPGVDTSALYKAARAAGVDFNPAPSGRPAPRRATASASASRCRPNRRSAPASPASPRSAGARPASPPSAPTSATPRRDRPKIAPDVRNPDATPAPGRSGGGSRLAKRPAQPARP